ncbi:MAG: hypothetical protein HKN48_00500 [Flavobacteriaceae bacterium]|nr:hypothetical protein [Flavobacteriaceae bacterium]
MKKIFPAIGILVFFGIYFFSSTLYPGGTQIDSTTVGFSWFQNYWCDLMETEAYNGESNPAQPYALAAMIMLCVSLSVFFYKFPKYFYISPFWNRLIVIFGIGSMIAAVLVASPLHNSMIAVASILGLFALIGIIYGVIKHKLRWFTVVAVICMLLIGFNNYSYYSREFVYWLPLLQKISFAVILGWLFFLNLRFLKIDNS